MWRDNHDGTMSLFDGNQVSCKGKGGCEWMPLKELAPLYKFIKEKKI
jgi:hypothetical protein